MNSTEQFFYDNAGWAYDPKTETSDQGRRRCARSLAVAEQWRITNGAWFQWEQDDIDSSFFSDEQPVTPLFWCGMYLPGHKHPVQSLGGIDDRGSAYARIIQAELALQEMSEQDDAHQARELATFTEGG